MTKTNSLGLYVHIPFCIKKCGYCDFVSFSKKTPDEWSKYQNELLKEIKVSGKSLAGDYIVDTVFFGGGTPSLLNPQLIQEIIGQIKESFQVTVDAEITIEVNPGTLTREKLSRYLDAGINRLSIGVQSFDEELLSLLGRTHGNKEIFAAYKMARDTGFKNISLDLMFAIPTQSIKSWESSINETIRLNPEHISFYELSYEEGTPFNEARKQKELIPVEEELDIEMYRKGISLLVANGYANYEISSMSKPGFECKHNKKYWSMEEYLGLGIGAHSFIKGKRLSNTGSWDQYFTLNKVESEHQNSEYDNMSEYIFTGMRKTDGIYFKNFKDLFNIDYFDYIGNRKEQLFNYRDRGFMVVDSKGMRFTQEGVDFSDKILADLI